MELADVLFFDDVTVYVFVASKEGYWTYLKDTRFKVKETMGRVEFYEDCY